MEWPHAVLLGAPMGQLYERLANKNAQEAHQNSHKGFS